jgi:hypothetical protein
MRLARGQTIADVTARIPAIESALGTYRGAVRVYPTGDGKADRCELRVLDTDPHAAAVPASSWCPHPSTRRRSAPAHTYDRSARTRPAREAFLKRFEREVDPDNKLPADERHRRAEHAKRAYMLQLAKRAVAARNAGKAQ